MQINLLIFDDDQGDFGPLADLKPAFELRTGALTTRQRIENALGASSTALIVPEEIADLAREQNPGLIINAPLGNRDRLAVNGRWLALEGLEQVRALKPNEVLVQPDGQIIAARLSNDRVDHWVSDGRKLIKDAGFTTASTFDRNILIDRPWHILDRLQETLAADLAATTVARIATGRATDDGIIIGGQAPVHVDPTVKMHPGSTLLADQGPIVIDRGATLYPNCVLEGPCYIGPQTHLVTSAYIRPNTVIGPECKVAGEVSFSIFQGCANKAHLGYLGHSLVGQWVNLGADTTVSNLKNTYGKIRIQMDPDKPAQDTGRIFHGPIFGDFVRTAIGTRILTGSCLGTGAMIALSGFAPKLAGRFGFYTDDEPEGSPYDMDKFLETARIMMSRKNRLLTPTIEKRLRQLAAGNHQSK